MSPTATDALAGRESADGVAEDGGDVDRTGRDGAEPVDATAGADRGVAQEPVPGEAASSRRPRASSRRPRASAVAASSLIAAELSRGEKVDGEVDGEEKDEGDDEEEDDDDASRSSGGAVAALNDGTLGDEDTRKVPAVPTPRRLVESAPDDAETEAVGEPSAGNGTTDNEDDDEDDGVYESDDDTWTPSIGSDEDYCSDSDDDEDPNEWVETPMRYADFDVRFNGIDHELERSYVQEVKQVKKRLIKEYKAISGTKEKITSLTENEILNVFLPAEVMVSIISFMNRSLTEKCQRLVEFREFEPFLRLVFWLCFYKCSVSDIEAYPDAYPLALKDIDRLGGNTTKQKIKRLNQLLRSLDGRNVSSFVEHDDGEEDGDEELYFNPVYGIDRELEKLFRDLGGQASSVAFVEGYTNLIIDDEKTRGRSTAANDKSLARSKSAKAFGPVGNCVNSVSTGIPLSCHYSHHGESATDVIKANLMIIKGVSSDKLVKMNGTDMAGDRGYNDDEYFEYVDTAGMGALNTMKRGPKMPFKFGQTRYKTTREQRDIPENGPVLSLGATRAVGSTTIGLVGYRNGTGRVTFLASSDPSLRYGNIEYVTSYSDIDYAKTFKKAVDVLSKKDGYDPTSLLSGAAFDMRYHYDAHNVYEATRGQGGHSWLYLRPFHIVSTLSYAATPRERESYSAVEASLVENDLGLKLKRGTETFDQLEWQNKSTDELKELGNKELIEICKAYGRPYSNKNKEKLVSTVQLGPTEAFSMTEFEKVMKHTLLSPLPDKDRAAHKLGSLNEANVRSIMRAVAKGVGYELVSMAECGLLINKDHKWLATSLDGFLILKKASSSEDGNASHSETDSSDSSSDSSDDDDAAAAPKPSPVIGCGLEIKTPSGKKILEKVKARANLHGLFSTCTFGDERFKQLVYKPEYRTQVLHHAVAANLDYVLFVVASENSIHYATLIRFPRRKRLVFLGILEGVYRRCLRWAYEEAWTSNDPMAHMPEFRASVVSSKSYPVDREAICFVWFVWKKLMELVEQAKLPLPQAKKIVPAVVAKWNRCKGRIDEQTRHLDEILSFKFSKGTPKQKLILRELKKLVLSTYFSKKHCFPEKPIPKGEGYTAIQTHMGHSKKSVKKVLFTLASTYKVKNPINAIIPGSPIPKRASAIGGDVGDEVDQQLSLRDQSAWQAEAKQYCAGKVGPGTRRKFEKFCEDQTLDRIRLDAKLNHTARSIGSYKDPKARSTEKAATRSTASSAESSGRKRKSADLEVIENVSVDSVEEETKRETRSSSKTKRTNSGRTTRSAAKSATAKAVSANSRSGKAGSGGGKKVAAKRKADAAASEEEPAKKRPKLKASPRCVVCTALATTEDEKKNICKSLWYCPTCCVHLCTEKKGNKKTSCFERWHKVTALADLKKNKNVATGGRRLELE